MRYYTGEGKFMYAHTTYTSHRRPGKRRRQVYLKKLFLCFITSAAVISLSIILGSNFAAAHSDRSDSPVEHKYYKSIEISYGDTLWSIAQEYMNDDYSSVSEYIYELKEINQLDSIDDIHASRYLTVVYYDTEFKQNNDMRIKIADIILYRLHF